MINLYKINRLTTEEVEALLKEHEAPLPRNWEMRIQKVFSSFGLDDFTTLMKRDYFEQRYPLDLHPRDYVWYAILSEVFNIWKNHRAWT